MRPLLFRGSCFSSDFDVPALIGRRVDLVLTDPPWGATANIWDLAPDPGAFWELVRSVAHDRTGVLVFADYKLGWRLASHRHALPFAYDLIWEKNRATGHLNAHRRPMRAHETIFVFGNPRYAPDFTDGHKPMNAARNLAQSTTYGTQRATGETANRAGSTTRHPRSVFYCPVVNNDDPARIHPAQKPIDLLRRFVRMYSPPGGVVFDPFAGSAASLRAAHLEHRFAYGFEVDAAIHARALRALDAFLDPGGPPPELFDR